MPVRFTASQASAEASKSPSAATTLYDLARVNALCVAAVLNDKDLSSVDRDKLAETYSDQAVAFLTRAAEAKFFTGPRQDLLKKDADLDAVRDTPGFAALLKKLANP